jgi:hypothetical protein
MKKREKKIVLSEPAADVWWSDREYAVAGEYDPKAVWHLVMNEDGRYTDLVELPDGSVFTVQP